MNKEFLKEIEINEIEGFRIGNDQDIEGGTGCTAIICNEGAVCGVDVRGGGPATRETDLLEPSKMVEKVHAVLLSGGSAYGLNAATGVMKYLEENDIGFDVGLGRVPIVPAACLFDLVSGDPKCRPDEDMGYGACKASENNMPKKGNYGAGTGATVGKYLGLERLMKGGLGIYAVQIGELKIGAIVAVNCLGDVYDVDTGLQIAGILNKDKTALDNTREIMWNSIEQQKNVFTGNTTIGCIITNAKLTKAQCSKMASMAHNGYATAIKPVHTSADGDTIFYMAKGDVEVNADALGDLGAYVMAKAIGEGVKNAKSAYGFTAMCDI